MSISKTPEKLHSHRADAINKLDSYISDLISSDDHKLHGKADKLSYWLEDWTTFLAYEPQFVPSSRRRYKRGEIIKVHLGFNIGSEEGGLHYAVVLDKNNAKTSPVLTIVPLTSVKEHTDTSHLKSGSVFLGNELFTSLSTKISTTQKHTLNDLHLLTHFAKDSSPDLTNERIQALSDKLDFIKRMRLEILKMKKGSIALVNQITTVSKIRIYDPKTDHDILSNIRLSDEKLDLIDQEIAKKFTNL